MRDVVLMAVKKGWLPVFIVLSLGFVAAYLLRAAHELRLPLVFSPVFLLATALVTVAYWITASMIWRHVVAVTSAARLTRMQSLAQLVTVSLGKYLPGKVWGMLARGAQLAEYGVSRGEAVISTFYEQYILLHASAVLCCLLATFLLPQPWAFAGLAATILIALGGTKARAVGIRAFFYLMTKAGRGGRAEPRPVETRQYISLLTEFSVLWLLNSLVFAGLFFSFFDADASSQLFLVLVLANVAGVTLGFFAVFSPGGIGVREAIISAVMSSVMPLGDAILLSVLYRVWVVLSELIGGIVVVIGRAHAGRAG